MYQFVYSGGHYIPSSMLLAFDSREAAISQAKAFVTNGDPWIIVLKADGHLRSFVARIIAASPVRVERG